MIASGAPVISATQAFLKPPDWSEYGQERLYFQKHFGKGRYIEFYVLNKQKHQAESISTQAEREILEQYGVMAARLHAVFATDTSLQSEPWKEPFHLLGTDLIKTLKVHNSNKFTKSQKLKAVADLAWVVGTLGAVIHWFEGDMDLCVRERSLLWIVSVQEYTQPNVDGESEELHEVVIRVQPGLWTHSFLNREGAQQRKALYQYGLIPKEVFDIDPHRRKMATSMALYLIQNSRSRPNGVYTVESLLESVLPSSDIEKALSDRRYGWKLKESVDNALLILKDNLKIDIDFDNETYPLWLRPVWSLPDEIADLPTKERNQQLLGAKWLPDSYISKHWFPAKLTFRLPMQIQECLDYRKAAKSVQAFASSLPKHVHPITGRIHPDYQQMGAATGRMSCRNPNLQQIPRDKIFRSCFIPAPGYRLVVANYSQIELRVAAELSGDRRMIEAYQNDEDLHRLTAALIADKSLDQVEKSERQAAKAVNFGLIYAMGAKGLAEYAYNSYGVQMSLKQAETFRKRYFEAYQGIAR